MRLFNLLAIVLAIIISCVICAANNDIVIIVTSIAILLGVLSVRINFIIPAAFILGTTLVPSTTLPFFSNSIDIVGYNSFGFVRLHPASIVIFVGSLLNCLKRRHQLADIIQRSKTLRRISAIMIVFFALIFCQTFIFRGFKGIPQCLENYLIPYCFFLFLLTMNPKQLSSFATRYTIIISTIALLGIFEFFLQSNFIYGNIYDHLNVDWFSHIKGMGYRITTTIGHPLINATYFLFAIPIALSHLRKPLNIFLTFILSLAVLATGSRAGTLIMVISFILYNYRFSFNPIKHIKLLLSTTAIIFILGFAVFNFSIGTTLLARFAGAQKSSEVRFKSMNNISILSNSNIFFGKGMGSNFDDSSDFFGHTQGYENPWIMLIADVGLFATILYMMIILFVVAGCFRIFKYGGTNKAFYVSFISVLLMLSGYNSFGMRNTTNLLVWFNIALLLSSLRIQPNPDMPIEYLNNRST